MRRHLSLAILILILGSMLIPGTTDSTTGQSVYSIKNHYTKAEYMVPMRDGTKLFTQVYTPKDQTKKYPILLLRTPYSVGNYGLENFKRRLGPAKGYAEEGFIFVYQDVRGKFKSQGEFIVMKPQKI